MILPSDLQVDELHLTRRPDHGIALLPPCVRNSPACRTGSGYWGWHIATPPHVAVEEGVELALDRGLDVRVGRKHLLRLAQEAQTDRPIARMIRFIARALRLTVPGRNGRREAARVNPRQPPGQPIGDQRLVSSMP
jgi:hypothetical protein